MLELTDYLRKIEVANLYSEVVIYFAHEFDGEDRRKRKSKSGNPNTGSVTS
jgi:hypothetical protein